MLLLGWTGHGSPWNLLIHSALIPLYLLWEADSRKLYRFVGAQDHAVSRDEVAELKHRLLTLRDHVIGLEATTATARAQVAEGFGRLRPAAVVEVRLEGTLPLSCRTVITAPGR